MHMHTHYLQITPSRDVTYSACNSPIPTVYVVIYTVYLAVAHAGKGRPVGIVSAA